MVAPPTAFDDDTEMSATMSVSDRLRGSRGKISPAVVGGRVALAMALAVDALLCEADFLVPPPETAAFCFLAPRATEAICEPLDDDADEEEDAADFCDAGALPPPDFLAAVFLPFPATATV